MSTACSTSSPPAVMTRCWSTAGRVTWRGSTRPRAISSIRCRWARRISARSRRPRPSPIARPIKPPTRCAGSPIPPIARRSCRSPSTISALEPGERAKWETDPAWQGFRELVEKGLVAYDWAEGFVAMNLIARPAVEEAVLRGLGASARHNGDTLLGLLTDAQLVDADRHRRWSSALVKLALGEAGNKAALDGWVAKWAPARRRRDRRLLRPSSRRAGRRGQGERGLPRAAQGDGALTGDASNGRGGVSPPGRARGRAPFANGGRKEP